jgi:hypothetical protein
MFLDAVVGVLKPYSGNLQGLSVELVNTDPEGRGFLDGNEKKRVP